MLSNKNAPMVAIIGAGGKTSLLMAWCKYLHVRNEKFLITTTTKLAITPDILYYEAYEEIKKNLSIVLTSARPVARIQRNNKAEGFPPIWLDKLRREGEKFTCVYEADGAKGRSLKAHAQYEPVVATGTDCLLIVVGCDSIGKLINERNFHRADIISEMCKKKIGSVFNWSDLSCLLERDSGYLINSKIPNKFLWLTKADLLIDYKKTEKDIAILREKLAIRGIGLIISGVNGNSR